MTLRMAQLDYIQNLQLNGMSSLIEKNLNLSLNRNLSKSQNTSFYGNKYDPEFQKKLDDYALNKKIDRMLNTKLKKLTRPHKDFIDDRDLSDRRGHYARSVDHDVNIRPRRKKSNGSRDEIEAESKKPQLVIPKQKPPCSIEDMNLRRKYYSKFFRDDFGLDSLKKDVDAEVEDSLNDELTQKQLMNRAQSTKIIFDPNKRSKNPIDLYA